jgi:hypothetical protein
VSALAKLRTLWRLGPANLVRVGLYRGLLRAGHYRCRMPVGKPLRGPFFVFPDDGSRPRCPALADAKAWTAKAQRVLGGELPVFSNAWREAGFPPRWQRSVITQIDEPARAVHWSTLPDFALAGGDVKGYWESSRFDGLLILALGWLCSGQAELREGIGRWLDDWCAHNPANTGLQWKCGQETGLRLMQVLLVADLLERWGGVKPAPALADFVHQHVQRIAPTMLYAVAQDNNHGTSEAAALFVAGLFLARHGDTRAGHRHAALGRRWLEERIGRLVMRDGSFSQHSTNYHRLMLDTCALAETVRRAHGAPAFAAHMHERLAAATHWLDALTDTVSGDAPNLGANDGARLFVLDGSAYRDFRPSVRWAARLFLDAAADAGDERLAWLGLDRDARGTAGVRKRATQLLADGGYARLGTGGTWALLRLPRYRFRPSHADALHLDLWVNGVNRLRDGGSFSYNAQDHWLRYFGGTASHNTVQFDGRDQMPRLSRFLFGDWLQAEELALDEAGNTASAAYRDGHGAFHRRRVRLERERCIVVDEVSGFVGNAVLRWRIAPAEGGWHCADGVWSDAHLRISVGSSTPITRFECVEGWESRHYDQKSPLPVLEVEVSAKATLTTEISWPA